MNDDNDDDCRTEKYATQRAAYCSADSNSNNIKTKKCSSCSHKALTPSQYHIFVRTQMIYSHFEAT